MPKRKMTIEDLARMIKKGFDQAATKKQFELLDKRMDSLEKRAELVEKRLEIIENRLEHIEARLARIERDTSYLRNNFVSPKDFEDLAGRVKYLEIKMGIKSGK